jgi:hypothetical protein
MKKKPKAPKNTEEQSTGSKNLNINHKPLIKCGEDVTLIKSQDDTAVGGALGASATAIGGFNVSGGGKDSATFVKATTTGIYATPHPDVILILVLIF